MICKPQNEAQRHYTVRCWTSSALVVALAIASKLALHMGHLQGPLAWIAAIVPAIPIVWMLGATGVYIAEEKDEFVRNLYVQCLLAGIGGTLAITTVWGYLEDSVTVPRLDLIWVFPMFWIIVVISWPFVRARYR